MYGKHYMSMYTGSMLGAGPVVFAVWGYVIAHARNGSVELNPTILAVLLGTSEAEVHRALDYLMAPDPRSRSKEEEGRRLIKCGEFIYDVPTHGKYRGMRDDDDRREYMREYMKAYRRDGKVKSARDLDARKPASKNRKPKLAYTEAEAEAETKPKTTSARKKPRAEGTAFSLAPYIDAHREFFPGADVPAARYGRAFKALEAKHGHPETLRRFKNCLAAKGTFASPEHLAQFWPEYDSAPEAKTKPKTWQEREDEATEERVRAQQKQIDETQTWLATRIPS